MFRPLARLILGLMRVEMIRLKMMLLDNSDIDTPLVASSKGEAIVGAVSYSHKFTWCVCSDSLVLRGSHIEGGDGCLFYKLWRYSGHLVAL
jgi:hypothetical protein